MNEIQLPPNLGKQKFAIFLDIDGVFNTDEIFPSKIDDIVEKTLKGKKNHTSGCNGCKTCKIAEAYLFESSAVECFE